MSRYFVGYLLEGEAARYYEKVTKDLAERFGIKNLSEYIPPHFTLKAPFESPDIEAFRKQLVELAGNEKFIPFRMEGFDSHQAGTIFLAVARNPDFQRAAERIVHALLDFGDNRGTIHLAPFLLHASVARRLEKEEKEKILAYLKTLPSPRFDMVFDNLTLFAYDDTRWEIEKIHRFA